MRRNRNAKNHRAGDYRRDGTRTGSGRLGTEHVTINLDVRLRQWLLDRAAILGVPYTTMLRDVLATWKQLVVSAEQEEGLSLDLPEYSNEYDKILVPDRIPGYRSGLLPRGDKPTHLDDSPLSPTELI